MKTKTFYLLMFLTVMVGGVTDAWADTTHKLSLNGSASESLNNEGYGSTSFFTVARTSGDINYNPKFKDASYDGINFTSGLKMESGVTVSFTTSSISTVTIVQSSLIVNDSHHTITWNGTAQIVPASESGSGYYEYTFENVSAGTHTIGRGSGESGIFYVKVVEHSFTTDYTVTNVTLDGKSRPWKGTLAFTAEGSMDSGTEISDVPGITAIVTKGSSEMKVKNFTSGSGYHGYMLKSDTWNDQGATITFSPYVNGFLSLQGSFYTNASLEKASDNTAIWSVSNNNDGLYTDLHEIEVPLLAGENYVLKAGTYSAFAVHAFSFRPAFLNPTTGLDQTSTTFSATIGYPAVNGFPKLINPESTEQQNKVKFAGDKTKVYLYKNNDVELLDAGSNILIRGTVLDKNGNDGLVAYYYLNSNLLKMDPAIEFADQAYIDIDDIDKYNGPSKTYAFKNANSNDDNKPMELVSGATITVQKDGETPYTVTPTFSTYKWEMYVPVTQNNADLEAGATYRITIPAGSVKETNTGYLNPEIVRTFSVNKQGELQVKMTYPSGLATVGTTIILETYVDGSITELQLNDNAKVTGVLSAVGETDMPISAIFEANKLVFKPERTLKPNTTYSLTITYNATDNVITSKPKNNTIYKVTHTKVFTFKTGSSSGIPPHVTSTTPSANAELDANTQYASGTISFTFDQDVELEPYSTVTATPINGSESTATGKTGAPGATNTLTVGSDGRTVSFNYAEDGLKYDLYYEVVIPVNTVVGAGGTPNDTPITLKFKMGRNPSVTAINANTFYPHTWDFSKFGIKTETINDLNLCAPTNVTSGTSEEKEAKKAQARNSGWQIINNDKGFSYCNYWTNGMVFPQGKACAYNKGTTATPVNCEIPEMAGLRWSLTQRSSTSTDKRVQIKKQGSDAYLLAIGGGTHYVTIPDVPVGEIYIRASVSASNVASRLSINSDNATFIQGYASENNKQIGIRDGATRVYVVEVSRSGDVSFCLQDVTFYQIAVTTQKKTVGSVGYATNARSYPVDYSLDNTFLGSDVEAYMVTGVSNGYVTTKRVYKVPATTVIESTNGVLLKNSGDWPLFTLDVNSEPETMEDGSKSNLLIGVVKEGDIDTHPGILPQYDSAKGKYNYILAANGYNVKYDNGNGTGKVAGNIEGLGFYLVLKDGTKLANGETYHPATTGVNNYTAYLQLSEQMAVHTELSGVSTARNVFMIDFGEETTKINLVDTMPISHTASMDDAYYSLEGLRVEYPGKGLYIHKGKRVVLK